MITNKPGDVEYELETDRSLAALEKIAALFDCEVVIPEDEYTLLLDIDTPEAFKLFQEHLGRLQASWPELTYEEDWASKSGNLHVRCRLGRETTEAERILLQALLGSDLRRELISYIRARVGLENPVVLFKPKTEIKDAWPVVAPVVARKTLDGL